MHQTKSLIQFCYKLKYLTPSSINQVRRFSSFKCIYTLNKMTPTNVLSQPATCRYTTKATLDEEQALMDINCKIAIVLGQGFQAAEELLRAGVRHVVIADTNRSDCCKAVDKLNAIYGHDKAVFFSADFCDPKEYIQLFEEAIARFQKVDILYNVLDVFDDLDWVKDVNCNIKSVARCTMLAHHYMNKKRNKDLRGSVVINSASPAALDTLYPMPVYCTTESAVIGFSRSIGHPEDYERTGVRVVALCTGLPATHQSQMQLDRSWELDLNKLPEREAQSESAVGRAVVHLVRFAPTGSVWVLDDTELLRADIPNPKLYNKPEISNPPVLVRKPQRRRTTSGARSFVRYIKLCSYRVHGKKRLRPNTK